MTEVEIKQLQNKRKNSSASKNRKNEKKRDRRLYEKEAVFESAKKYLQEHLEENKTLNISK
nr:hypothetical protein [Eggerthia catenaformis]